MSIILSHKRAMGSKTVTRRAPVSSHTSDPPVGQLALVVFEDAVLDGHAIYQVFMERAVSGFEVGAFQACERFGTRRREPQREAWG